MLLVDQFEELYAACKDEAARAAFITALLDVAEAGLTTNEPDQLALQQAIEKAVYAMVMEGVELKLWDFADAAAGWPMLWGYQQERSGQITAEQADAMRQRVEYAEALEAAAPAQSRPRLDASAIQANDMASVRSRTAPRTLSLSDNPLFSGGLSASGSTVSTSGSEQAARSGL